MKKMIINSLLGILLCSCGSFLEPQSQNEFVPETVQSLEELLTGEVYMGPWDGGLFTALGVFDDDVAWSEWMECEDGADTYEQKRLPYAWDDAMYTDMGGFGDMYETCYKKIARCNVILDYADNMKGTDEERVKLKAQTYTMRAFYYFFLVNTYGKPYSFDKESLGVPLKTTSALEAVGIPRSTVKETYDLIVSDLKKAEDLFKSLPEEKQWNPVGFKASLPMVQLLLSRVYLYMEDWKSAVAYGEKVIMNPTFHLLNLNTIPEPDPEVESPYFEYHSRKNPEVIFLFGAFSDVVSQTESRIWRGNWASPKNYALFSPSKSLMDCYDEDPTDLRKPRYILQSTPGDYRTGWRAIAKTKTRQYFSFNINDKNTWGSSLRLCEAYLNAIEGAVMLYQAGDNTYLQKAMEWWNELRHNRHSAEVTELGISDPATMVELIRKERRCELCFEHHRWYDLRRYGMEPIEHVWYSWSGEPVTYRLEKNDPGFTLLIPSSAISKNPHLIQNERRTSNK